jgi:hypothetical protein
MKLSSLSRLFATSVLAAAASAYVDAQAGGSPSTPGGQSTPATPGQTSTPNQPSTPSQPPTPGQPTTPGQPASPGQPRTGTPGQTPAVPGRPTTPAQPQTVTLRGCVESGAAAGSATGQSSYQLTHIQPAGATTTAPGSSSARAGATSPATATSSNGASAYQLAAGQGVDFSGHVGQMVEVIGMTIPASAAGGPTAVRNGTTGPSATTPPSKAAGGSAPGTTTGIPVAGQGLSTFTVSSVHVVPGACQ